MQEVAKTLWKIELRIKDLEKAKERCENDNAKAAIWFRLDEIKRIKKVIVKNMANINDVVEVCPHCGNEVTIIWDVERDGYQVYCPYCGAPIMLCGECDVMDGAECDWEEEGCRRSDERYRDYYYKHMNNGWIPVEERLPEEKVNPVSNDFYEYQVTAKFGNGKDVRSYKYGNGHWRHGLGIVDKYVIAWRENPEPYRQEQPETCKYTGGSCCWPIDQCGECPNHPERSDNYDGK